MKETFLSRFTPSLMAPEALEAIFVQREDLAQRIVSCIREVSGYAPIPHTLLLGPRGIGKTHLVSLIYYRVRAIEEIRDSLRIAWLREEEWGVTSLLDFLLRVLRALVSEYEEDKQLARRVEYLYTMVSRQAERAAITVLRDFVRNRSLLVLVENLDDLYRGLGETGRIQLHLCLRENPFWNILATAQGVGDEVSLPESWFSLFWIHRLEELGFEDAVRLVSNMARYCGDEELRAFVSTPMGRARMRALKYLAGGNHRVYVIFSQFLTREALDELVEPLIRTIDDLTPYYQSRMAWLTLNQRKIIEWICERRRAVSLAEVCRYCFMDAQAAAAQLDALCKIGNLNCIAVGEDKYYELREPLMRLSIEVKKQRTKPIPLLIDFLRLWYSPSELRHRVAMLPVDSARGREYGLPALHDTGKDLEDPRISSYCQDYKAAVEQGDFVKALHAVEELVAIRDDVQDLFAQAFCFSNLGRDDAAVACYEKIVALHPEDPTTWLYRGSALYRAGKYPAALESCERAIELDSEGGRAWSIRGTILLSMGNPEAALASCEKAVRLDAKEVQGWLTKGTALAELGRYEDGLASYSVAIQLEPQNVLAHVYRGGTLIELKRYDEALATADRAIQIAPDCAVPWVIRATALAALGKNGRALDSCQQAIELGEDSSFVHFKRVELLLAENRWREGSACLDAALSRYAAAKEPDAGNTASMVRILVPGIQNAEVLRMRIRILTLIYQKHRALSALAHGLVACIPDLVSTSLSDIKARTWSDAWRDIAGAHPEFRLPLRLVDVAVRYRDARDFRVLLELPLEERVVLEPLLGVEQEATA